FTRMSIALSASQRAQKSLAAVPDARISGTVLDEDKKPVAGAVLNAQGMSNEGFMGMRMMMPGEDTRNAISGSDGRFTVRTPREGDVAVEATKKGFPSAKSASIRVAAGDRKTGVMLTIPRGIALTGRVTDGNNRPLSGVAVTTAVSEGNGGGPGGMRFRRMIMSIGSSESDEDVVRTGTDGKFTVRVKEGLYDINFKR